MDSVLVKLHNADTNVDVYVNIASIVWIVNDSSPNLLVGLMDGTRFHMTQTLKDLPPSFTSMLK